MKSSLLILGLKSAQADATRKEIKTIDYDQDEQVGTKWSTRYQAGHAHQV